ncbi:von Hippel-Lindau disease tumor suppressor-like [Babylonia areolata]|uniref:von Hippel-Lindau disease tumor suppressor-like n=1 Tax=Babylonia areolata TaxID=304850 RepID=UPI003FD49F43
MYSAESERLCSGRSRNDAFIRFLNVSPRRASVFWINFTGSLTFYSTLGPGEFLDVNTFEGHPWLVEDGDSGDKLVVNGCDYFWPAAYNPRDGWPPQRIEAKIYIPVYGLQERCLQVVRDMLSPDQVEGVEVPLILRREIRQAIDAKLSRSRPSDRPS